MKNLLVKLFCACFISSFMLFCLGASEKTIIPDSGIKLQKGADYQIVEVYKYPDFKIIQFNQARLSHFSYMLISNGQCMVIDPGRDAAIYEQTAKKEKAEIKAVFLTHSHADFVAGHLELANRIHCPVYVNKDNGAKYPHKSLVDDSLLKIGDATVKFITTPGHTPDGMCAIVYGKSKPEKAEVVFTGDTLFVGSVGRPDLLEGTMSAVELASKMYDSWFKKLALLNDEVVVLPAHGAGSLCGSKLGKAPASTIGNEKKNNPYLQHKSKNDFIAAVLNSLDQAPQYFAHNATMNRQGPDLVDWKKLPGKELMVSEVNFQDPKTYIVDVRPVEEYAAGHIVNSINIPASGKTATWIGIVVPWGAKLVITGSPGEISEVAHRLQRIGYKPEYISLEKWLKGGGKTIKMGLLSPQQVYKRLLNKKDLMPLDVRKTDEWNTVRIGRVINMPLQTLQKNEGKLDKSKPMVTICRSGYRAGIAAGLLARDGFSDMNIMKGGMSGWIDAGLPTSGAVEKCSFAAFDTDSVPELPEVVTVDGLNRLIKDRPGFIEIIDIRPAEHFNDYSIKGSKNVELKQLLSKGISGGNKTLIIVDRDGTLAFIAAGMLANKLDRKIKALEGGVENYWRENFSGKIPAPASGTTEKNKPAKTKPQAKKNIIQDAGC